MQDKAVILKKNKDKPFRQKHHWIFSGAILSYPKFKAGDILPVYSFDGDFIGSAYFKGKKGLAGRFLCFNKENPIDVIKKNIYKALKLREKLFDLKKTNAYRVINSEGDQIPGLIVDRYAEVIIIQISTLGIDRLKKNIVGILKDLFPNYEMIYEKSNIPIRKEEGLEAEEGLLAGKFKHSTSILENGVKFEVSFQDSQKTGFFLDQRERREDIRRLSRNKRVLNTFSYTGGFSIYAALGGAKTIDSVEISKKALELSKTNFIKNNLIVDNSSFHLKNVFNFLYENPLDYDLIILDPPAFAKKKGDVIQACRAYKEINRLAMEKMPEESYLLTCSCSYHVSQDLFQKLLFQAACDSGRTVQILSKHHQSKDHLINIHHPESDYLKSFLLYVT